MRIPHLLRSIGIAIIVVVCNFYQVTAQNIVRGPSDVVVLKGGTVQLTCQLSQSLDGSKNLRWSQMSSNLNGETLGAFYIVGKEGTPTLLFPIEQKPQLARYSINITGNNYDLVIEDADVQVDDAQYNCWVDSQPTTGAQLTVAVRASNPAIYNSETDAEYRDGETVKTDEEKTLSLRCETKGGRPTPRISWYRGDQEFVCNGLKCNETTDNGDGTYDSSSTIMLEIEARDNGISVNCTVEQSGLATLPSATLLLDVEHAPIVEVVFDEKSHAVSCKTEANPSEIESYVWQINGTVKDEYDNMPTLQLKDTDELEGGIEVSCIAANSFGSGSNSLIIPDHEEPETEKSSDGLSSGAVAGIVIVFLIVVIVVVVVIFLRLRDKKKKKTRKSVPREQKNVVDPEERKDLDPQQEQESQPV